MHLEWHFTPNDVELVKGLVADMGHTKIVLDRHNRNLKDEHPPVTVERLWRAMVCMRLTTMARSGPGTPLSKFQSSCPFLLGYSGVHAHADRHEFILQTIKKAEVGTHRKSIAKDLSDNFESMEKDRWLGILEQCNKLTDPHSRATESSVADYVQEKLNGFGPKQSRNILQALGLTRWEIPLDSRVANWLNKTLNFPIKITPQALSDRHFYGLILDAICTLCERCDVLPCVFDASVFGSDDADTWTEEEVVY